MSSQTHYSLRSQVFALVIRWVATGKGSLPPSNLSSTSSNLAIGTEEGIMMLMMMVQSNGPESGQVMRTEVAGGWLILSLTAEPQLSLLNTRNEFLSQKFTAKLKSSSRKPNSCIVDLNNLIVPLL
ncbi:unnamed protein product [Sphenostylis stenocarpa]|uniref:Uncharacterized protein n=1 Tax=Sphenostylis stenocarpa TaxID=92480 RepID=A0AA86W3U3_9FABA|nr:unnamed protein product [Sphenostylis stenocarpa]